MRPRLLQVLIPAVIALSVACGGGSDDTDAGATEPASSQPTATPSESMVASTATPSGSTPTTAPEPTPTQAPASDASSPASGGDGVAAIVEGEEITETELDARFQQAQARAAQQGQTFQGEEQIKEVKDQILDQLVNETLLRQQAEEEGITASDSEVSSQFDQMTGQFPDEATLNTVLEQQGLTKGDLRELIADNLVIQELVQTVIDEAEIPAPSEEEIQSLYDQLSSQQENVPPLDQVKEQIVQQLTQGEQQQVVQEFIDQLEESADVEILR